MKKLTFIAAYLILAVTCIAETINVDDDGPADFNTIQAAIDDANDGDTVIVAAGIYTGEGNRNISFLGKAITVRSESGPENCIIDCNGIDRGFYFHSGEGADSVLGGFTITNGVVFFGGGIYCQAGSNPTINNCVITGNTGSGLFCEDSSPVVANCFITGNDGGGRGGDGGGISVFGGLCLVYNSVISGNTANRYGGGICCDVGGDLEITSSIVAGNSAGNGGGGIYCRENSSLVVKNCTVTGNSAVYDGGGIFSESDTSALITNSVIWGNSDSNGTGQSAQIHDEGTPSVWFSCIQDDNPDDANIPFGDEQFNIDDDPCFVNTGSNDFHLLSDSPCIDTGNPNFAPEPNGTDIDGEPRVMGGRVDMGADEFTAEMIPVIGISDESFGFYADLGGSNPHTQILSIYNIGSGTLNWQIIVDCNWLTAEPNSGSSMGQDNNVDLMVDISGLSGGVYYCDMTVSDPNAFNSPRLIDVVLYVNDNSSSLYVPYQYPTIQSAIDAAVNGDTVIVYPGTYTGPGNRNIDFLGKAITVRSESGPSSCVVDCNGLSNGFNFHNLEDANSVLDGFTITNGTSSPYGGGIYCGGEAKPTIRNCVITGTLSSAIYCDDGGGPTVSRCIITGNKGSGRAGDYGGGIAVFQGLCIVYDSIISGNTARRSGGGIFCDYNGSVEVADCIITGNSAGEDGGGVFCGSENNLKITNSTIAGNYCDDDGGGVWCQDSFSEIDSCIIWGNTVSGFSPYSQIYGSPQVSFSCIQDDFPDDNEIPFGAENGNIDDDPCFVSPGYWDVNDWVDGDYHLFPGSPCVDTGNPYFTYNVNDVDIDGQPRLMGLYVDMGADEVGSSLIVVTKPEGGEIWAAGSTHQIEWDSYNVNGTVNIIAQRPGPPLNVFFIDVNVPDTGNYTWNIPSWADGQHTIIVEPSIPVSDFTCINSGLFMIHPYQNFPLGGSPVPSHENPGPSLGCVKWQFSTNGPVNAGVAIGYNNNVHIPCEDGMLFTLDANGLLLWTFNAGSPLFCTPAVDRSGAVYVGAENGKLYALDRNGSLLWTHTTGESIYASPVVSPSYFLSEFTHTFPSVDAPSGPLKPPTRIYVASLDGTLYALAYDGSELWTFDTDGPGVASGAIFASPVLGPNNTILVAGYYDPNLYALDSNDGSVKWRCTFSDPCDDPYNLNNKLAPFASPVIAPDGTIYQTLTRNPARNIGELGDYGESLGYWYDSKLYAIDPNDGTVLWATNMTETAKEHEEPIPPLPPAPDPNCLFRQYYGNLGYPDYDRTAYSYPYTCSYVGCRSGVKRYFRVSNSSWSEPVLALDGTIYTSFNDQYLRAVDPNGNIKWVVSLGWFGGFTMAVGSDGLIYTASDHDDLSVVDPNGKEIARFEGSGKLSFPVITPDNSLIVSDSDNTVWALASDDCEGLPAALHRPEDLNADWSTNLIDFAVTADFWLECTDTSYNPVTELPYCNDDDNEIFLLGDVNRDQYVDLDDLAEIANNWLIQE